MGTRKQNLPRLLASELEMLEMLWRAGGVTIVEAQRALGQEIGYTTVQTRLNRLVKKGVVSRSTKRPAKYRAAITRTDVSSKDLNLLVDKVNEGRVVPLVAHLVTDRLLTVSEIAELKRLISQAERDNRRTRGKAR